MYVHTASGASARLDVGGAGWNSATRDAPLTPCPRLVEMPLEGGAQYMRYRVKVLFAEIAEIGTAAASDILP